MTRLPGPACRAHATEMRRMTRLVLLLFGVSLVSLLLIGRCGLRLEEAEQEQQAEELREAAERTGPERREIEHRLETQRLRAEIRALRRTVERLGGGDVEPIPVRWGDEGGAGPPPDEECAEFVERQVAAAEVHDDRPGARLNNEYEVIPFAHFTFNRVYPVEPGLGRRVVEKPIGYRRRELLEVLVRALERLNAERRDDRYTVDDFAEGLFRNDPTTGTQYALYFRERNASFRTLTLVRPFAPLRVVADRTADASRPLVNVIVPLSGRVERFRRFVDAFVRVAVRRDRRVFLTVVYFGAEGLAEVRAVLARMARDTGFRGVRLLALNETFSRGAGLQVGARHWRRGDVLLFLCDVDVVFSARFLDRCRLHAAPGRRVYYPIVFSLYNPSVVYSLQGWPVPPEPERLVISRDTGFWRDFGFGMTCQYRSDFLRTVGGLGAPQGWGGEDVLLYRRYVRGPLRVVRAADPGLFHTWHEKRCGDDLAPEQRRDCLRSRALTEASHAQMGLLAFREPPPG